MVWSVRIPFLRLVVFTQCHIFFVCWWTLGHIHLLTIMNNFIYGDCKYLLKNLPLNYFGHTWIMYLKIVIGITGSCNPSLFNSWRSPHAVLHSSCTSLQCTRVSISGHSHQNLFFLSFLFLFFWVLDHTQQLSGLFLALTASGPKIEPRSAVCRANTQPTILISQPFLFFL